MPIETFLKRLENIMRDDAGVDGTVQILSQVVWMLFLRVYDLKEENWELFEDDYESPIKESCRWRNWAVGKSKNEQITGEELLTFVNEELFPTLKGIEITVNTPRRVSIIVEMMEDANNYMKDGVCLRRVINLINEVKLDDYEESHAFNTIYEELLKKLQTAGKQGEYYTPRALTTFITNQVNPRLGETIADFACGTGGFLVDTINHLKGQVKSTADDEIFQNSIVGVEKKQLPYMLCTTNLLLNGIDNPNIIHGNSLGKNVRDYTEEEKVDVVLMNPPYGGHEQDSILNNFPSNLRNSETADLFMIEILYRLKENGRCGIILPDGFLLGSNNSKIAIKEKLMKECNLHTVIRLCGSIFSPYTTISTNLLFFDKTGSTKETWFYRFDLPEGYKAFSKTKPLKLEHMKCIEEWWNNRKEIKDTDTDTYKSKKYTIDEIIADNYNLDLCGFPQKDEVVLEPLEVIEKFQSKRDKLDKQMDKKLKEILELLDKENLALSEI